MPILVGTASPSGAIPVIIGANTAMAWAVTRSELSQLIVHTVVRASGSAVGFLLVFILLAGVLGSVLEGIPAIVLFGPLLFPVARVLHINEVRYAMVAILSMGGVAYSRRLSGGGCYVAGAIGEVDPTVAPPRLLPWGGAEVDPLERAGCAACWTCPAA